jgi:cytoskeletal protein CcmA (bactofilin family)
MKITAHILLPTLLLGAQVALASGPTAPAPDKAQAAPAVKTIDVSFRGSLRDALKRIAEEGGINVVATGDLDTSVEVHLKGVTAHQALRTIARTYSLRMDEDGSIFTLRPLTASEREATAAARAAPPEAAPAPSEYMAPPPPPGLPGMPPMPPVPPVAGVPPTPPLPLGISADDVDAREIQERVRDGVRKVQRRSRGDRDVVARGQSLEVKENETADNVVVYGGNLVVKGHVEEDAVVFGGNLDIHGHVEGDAHAFGGNVVLHPNASVQGDVSAIGGSVIRNDGAYVEGSTESFGGGNIGALVAGEVKDSLKKEFRKVEPQEEIEEEEDRGGDGFPGFLLKFAALFGLGFLGQIFFPNRMKELSAEIHRKPGLNGLTGLLAFIALFPISVVLAITIVGIPAAVALWLVFPLAVAMGLAAVASEIGMKVPVLRGRKTQAVVLALGLLVLLGVGSIPVLGWLVMFMASMVAFGAVVRTRFGHRPRGIPEPLTPSSTTVVG